MTSAQESLAPRRPGPPRVRLATLLAIVAMVGRSINASPARADWPQFGQPISTFPDNQEHSAVATDGAGGAIVAWHDGRFPTVNIFAEHVLFNGDLDPLWPFEAQPLLTDPIALSTADGGQTSPVIVPDGAGGAIVAWQDNRDPVTGTDIFAQHVLGTGEVDRSWPANGAALCTAVGVQDGLVIATDGAGGAYVAWTDSRLGAGEIDIFAQHVLASGATDARWPTNGLDVCTAPGRQEFPAIVSDGAGGAIIAWDDLRSAATGSDVFAQHVLSAGVVDPAWPVNGRALCAAPGGQVRPTIAPDGAHGAVVSWSDSRVVGTSHIFANHVLASGALDPAWPEDGRAISNAGVLESRPLAVSDGAGGAIVTWQAFTVHLNMVAQHITAAGVVDRAWPGGGRALSITPRQQSLADIVSDGAGGAVVAWQDSFAVVAQHVLSSGGLDPAYPDTGLQVCNLPTQAGDVSLVATGASGAIASWTDSRNGKDTDIYAMQVLAITAAGVPGPASSGLAFAPPSPNPARGSLRLQFGLPRSARVSLVVCDVTGRRLRELASGIRPAGEQSLTWDLRDDRGAAVGAGLYFVRLEADGRTITRKVATLH